MLLAADDGVALAAEPADRWSLPAALAVGAVDSAVVVVATVGVVVAALVDGEALEASGAAPVVAVALLASGAAVEAVPACPAPVWAALVLAVVSALWPAAAISCDELVDWPVIEGKAVAAAVPVADSPLAAAVVPVTAAGADPLLPAVSVVVEAAPVSPLAEEPAEGAAAVEGVVPAVVAAG